MQFLRFVTHRRWVMLTALVPVLIGSMLLSVLRVQAAGTTRYVNPNGVCGGQTPCYTSILNAINASNSGDTIVLQANITEGDLIQYTALTNLTIEGYSATTLVTISGGMNWPVVYNWTFQNLKITGDLAIQSAPTGVIINNVTFTNTYGANVGIGSTTAIIGGTLSITNNTFVGSASGISITGGDGQPINGNITISNNATVYAISVLAYVKAGGNGSLNANVTLNQNTIFNSANIGVTYRGNNTGVGNIAGNITFTNNVTTGADSLLGVTISGLPNQNVTGTMSGNMTFTGNTTYKIAAITTDSPGPSNMTGDINVSNNNCERVELGYHGSYMGNSIAVTNNSITYKGSPEGTFIAVDAYNFTSNAVIFIASNTGNTQMTVISRRGNVDAATTISNNQASHILYQVQSTNTAPFNIIGNVVTPASGQPGFADGYLVIQTGNGGAIGSGSIQSNSLANLQGSINGSLNGVLSLTGNWISGQVNLHTNALGSSGLQLLTGNHLNNIYTDTNTTLHFNTILGYLNVSGATMHAEDNWWGCNAGPGGCHSAPSGAIVQPHLVLSTGVTCTATTNLGVAFNLISDSNGTLTTGNITPAIVTTTSTLGTVTAPSFVLRNAAGGTAVTLPAGGGSPSVNVTVDSQTLTSNQTCNNTNAIAATIGIYRNGTFYLRNSNSTGFADITATFNPATTPYPIVGDWNGTGIDTIGVYDQSNGLFTLCSINGTASCANPGNLTQLVLGNPGDQPIAGRWSLTDTHDGAGVFRPSNGLIYLRNTLTTGFADYTMVLGIPGDVGLAGDWNGDGLDSPGVFRPSAATFYLSDQVTNAAVFGDYTAVLGFTGDSPFVGDWIAQGHAGIGVFRPTNGLTYLKNALTTGFADNTFIYGIAGDIPVAGHWGAGGPVPNSGVSDVLVPGTLPSTAPTAAPQNGLGD